MFVVLIVFFFIMLGVVGLGDFKKLGRIGVKIVFYFLVIIIVVIIIGLILVYVIKLGMFGFFDIKNVFFEVEKVLLVGEIFLNMILVNLI